MAGGRRGARKPPLPPSAAPSPPALHLPHPFRFLSQKCRCLIKHFTDEGRGPWRGDSIPPACRLLASTPGQHINPNVTRAKPREGTVFHICPLLGLFFVFLPHVNLC